MIFVSIGMHTQQFNRLIARMDEIAPLITDEVIVQKGYSDYIPSHCRYFDFATSAEMSQYIAFSSILVVHAGAGSILSAFKAKKKLLVVPRKKKYGEHMDDHQEQLAKRLNTEFGLFVAWEVQDITVELLHSLKVIDIPDKRVILLNFLSKYINEGVI